MEGQRLRLELRGVDLPRGLRPAPRPDSGFEADDRVERPLCCRRCHQAITSQPMATDVHGRHIHQFTNPHGFEYRIGCFREASNLALEGLPTARWSWFVGYRWQIVHCQRCALHLGWYFSTAEGQAFYGLILARLVTPDA
ncbi:MAG: cereblon family protein [Candidatus Competibacterales bacterium]